MGECSNLATISCSSHHDELVRGLWHLVQTRVGVNCDLLVFGRSIRAHRLVMQVFLSPDKLGQECGTDLPDHRPPTKLEPPVLHDDSEDPGDSLGFLLEFLYTGQVKLPIEKLSQLLHLARELDFPLLVNAIERKVDAVEEQTERPEPALELPGQTDASDANVIDRAVAYDKITDDSQNGAKMDDFSKTSASPIEFRTLSSSNMAVLDQSEMGAEGSHNFEVNDPVADSVKLEVATSDQSTVDVNLSDSCAVTLGSLKTVVPDSSKISVERDVKLNSSLKMESESSTNTTATILHDPATSASCTRRLSQRLRKLPSKFLLSDEWSGNREESSSARKRVKLTDPKKEFQNDVHPCPTGGLYDVAIKPDSGGELPERDDHRDGDSTERLTEMAGRPNNVEPVKPEPASYVNPKRGGSTTKVLLRHKYVCNYCDFGTNRETMYRIHLANHDPNTKSFHCPWCSKMFLSQVLLQGHRCVKVTTPKKYACSHCEFWDCDKAAYRAHLKEMHGVDVGAVFKCDECARPFLCLQSLERHTADKHGGSSADTFYCPHCKYETSKVWSYNHHLFSEHNINTKGDVIKQSIRCPKCDHTCRSQQHLHAHIKLHHRSSKGEIGCERCPFVVEGHRQLDLSRHVRTVHGVVDANEDGGNDDSKGGTSNILCDLCGYMAATTQELSEHRVSHARSKMHRCDICKKVMSDRNTLRRHVLIHVSKEKPYVCSVCPYASNRRDNLRSHLRNVHKITAYKVT